MLCFLSIFENTSTYDVGIQLIISVNKQAFKRYFSKCTVIDCAWGSYLVTYFIIEDPRQLFWLEKDKLKKGFRNNCTAVKNDELKAF